MQSFGDINVYKLELVQYAPSGKAVSSFSLRLSFVRPVALEKIPKGIFDMALCSTLTV